MTAGYGDPGQPQIPAPCPQVCYAGRCQNLLVYGNKNCSAKCNNHGVCCGIIPRPGQLRGPSSGAPTMLMLSSLVAGVQPQAGVPLRAGLGSTLL